MTIRKYILTCALVISFSHLASAASNVEETLEDKVAVFRQVIDITPQSIKVPTVVEIPLVFLPFSREQTAVLDIGEHAFVPNITVKKSEYKTIPVSVSTNKSSGNDASLIDKDFATFVDFDLPEGNSGEAIFILDAAQPFTTDAFIIELAPHVAMPEKVEIRAEVDGMFKTMLAGTDKQIICTRCIVFPETTASKWQVKIKYGQPLRVSEIAFRKAGQQDSAPSYLRFLALPDHKYQVLRDADRAVSIIVGESGNLKADEGVLRIEPVTMKLNPAYIGSDMDKDAIPDSRDNCVFVSNPDQVDVDGNLRGDACDDWDRDSVINSKDNCVNAPNVSQQDADSDGIGDVCDKEESRITEKYAYLPWLAIAAASALLMFFFYRVIKNTKPNDKL
jgi:hypothetical protein